MSLKSIFVEIENERERQDLLWGEQNHPDGTGSQSYAVERNTAQGRCQWRANAGKLTFRDILAEEFWEALAERDKAKLRAELVQVAAVAVAWVEKLDRETSHVG